MCQLKKLAQSGNARKSAARPPTTALMDAPPLKVTSRCSYPAVDSRNAGDNAAAKFLDFFSPGIRNLKTREAYARACA